MRAVLTACAIVPQRIISNSRAVLLKHYVTLHNYEEHNDVYCNSYYREDTRWTDARRANRPVRVTPFKDPRAPEVAIMVTPRGNSYQGVAYQDGKRVRRSFRSHQEALDFEAGKPAKEQVTIGETWPIWCNAIWSKTRNYRNCARNTLELVKRLGATTPIIAIDRARIRRLIDDLQSEGKAPQTINSKLCVVSKLMTFAVDDGIISQSPKIPFQAIPQGRIREYTVEEEDILISHLAPPYKQLAIFLLYTGCRVGEALALQWNDIKGEVVTFWRTKTDRPRSIPLAKPALAALQYMRERGYSRPFKPVIYSTFNKKWRVARAAAGLGDDKQAVAHALRHTLATRLAREIDPFRLQMWLGHSTPTMTKRYTHLNVNDLKTGLDVLNKPRG